jgi:hypothetical protein
VGAGRQRDAEARYVPGVQDDDDWVGTPPEGRHSRDRARPGFWANQWQAAIPGAVILVLVAIAVVVALSR